MFPEISSILDPLFYSPISFDSSIRSPIFLLLSSAWEGERNIIILDNISNVFCFQTSAVSYVLLSLLLLLLLSEQGENRYASRIGEIFNRAFWVTIHLFSVIRAARFLMIRDLKAAPWKEKKEGKREGGNCSAPFLSGGGGTAEEG